MNTEYITMRAAQLDRHKRVFTRWINMQLAKANPPADVKDLFNDLKDGQVLLTLVEVLLGIEVSRQKESRHRINQLSNVQQAMGHFGRNKVNTLGIIASEIVAGGQRATLSLVWSIIVRFQINEAIQPEPRDYGFDKKLMEWCQQRLQEYKGKVRIANFTTSWSDGLGFNALLHSFSPSVFDFDQISACDTATRLNHAFNVAATVYGVPKVVEPEDIVQDKPDKNLITLFLSYIYLLERREIVTVVTKEGEPEVTTKTYHFTTRYETTTSQKNGVTRETTIQYSGSTTEADVNDGLFYDVREEGGGNEKMLPMQGLPTGIHVQQERQEEAVEPSSTPQRSAVKTYKTYKVTTISTTTKTDNGNTPGPTDVKEKQIIDDVTKPTVKENVQEVTPVKVWLPREYAVEKKITVINKQDQQSSSDQHKNVLATTLDLQAEDSEEEKPANITTLSQPSSSDLDDSHSDGKENDYARCDPDDSSSNLLDYLTKRLDHADQRLFDLERSLINSDKDSMDLKSTKKALDQNKELAVELTSAESEIHDVLKEGSGFINKKCFDKPHEEYFTKRLNNTDNRVKALVDTIEKERQRLFDLYIILLKQHLERMNDWLLRAESRMALDDEIEPSYQEVQKQVMDHQKFQEDLANYSMANMILDLDLDDPAIDETARDWVKVLSERWAAVWNWAEEWKEKLNQALIDWEKFREEEQTLLTWLSSKEQALDTIKQTDITDENQVKADLSLLEGLEGEMDTQRNRVVSLHETGEQLIRDANYHNSVAKNIRDQTQDFDKCWEDISDTLKRRKNMLEDGNAKLKQIGSLMEELRSWMSDAEKFIKSLAEEKEPATQNIIEETIELKCKERDSNQLKIDEITKLEMELSGNIDKTSNRDMKNVTKPLIKRWNDISNKLNKYRNADLPYTKANDWSFMKFLKKTFATN